MQTFALIENGVIHTADLDWDTAQEMKDRHERFFPDLQWSVAPMWSTEGMERGEGLMERGLRIAMRYNKTHD